MINIFKKRKKEISTLSEYVHSLKEGDIAIDCGANVGKVTAELAGTGATVYAFEPNEFAFKELLAKFKDKGNVHCINKGVWDRNTTMKLYYHENSDEDEVHWSTGSSIVETKGNVRSDKFKEVEIIDLIEFVKNLGRKVSILKVDVEGAEYEILDRLIDSGLATEIDHIFVETHEHIDGLAEKDKAIRKKIREHNITNINLDWI